MRPETLDFDLCLIKFREDIIAEDPDKDVQMACLAENVPDHGSKCWIAGWGAEHFTDLWADSLKQASVTLLERSYCLANSGYSSSELGPEVICAGKLDNDGNGLADGGVDACNKDFGGPLICPIEGKAALVGVVSWRKRCAVEGLPGLYSSVAYPSSYKWIRETVDPATPMTLASNEQTLTFNIILMFALLFLR